MERGGRLAENFADVLREGAREALGLLPAAEQDADVRDAVVDTLGRARDTARSLRLRAVTEAAEAAIAAVRADPAAAAPSIERILEACHGLDGTAPLLRPRVVVCGVRLLRSVEGLPVIVDLVDTPADALRRARTESAAALVMSIDAIAAVAAPSELAGIPLYACASEDAGLSTRARAGSLGALAVLTGPLDVRALLPLVRARLYTEPARPMRTAPPRGGSAHAPEPLRVLLAHPSADRASALARALRQPDLEVTTTSDASAVLTLLPAVAPDLVILGDEGADGPAAETASPIDVDDLFGGAVAPAPRRAWPGADALAAVLAGHPAFADIPRVRVDATFGLVDPPLPTDPDARRAEVRRLLTLGRHLAVTRPVDVVTRALGPVSVLGAADREIAAARRSRAPLSAARLDLDDAAALRARGGPGAVRLALARLAGALRTSLRETDLVGRVGPHHLLLLLPACTADDARARITEVTARVAPDVGRVRIGAADSLSGFEDLLLRADRDRISGPERG